jgi:MerR family copper efflux transcriptional regulator
MQGVSVKDLPVAEYITIGALAQSTGVNVSAIRYYEEIGLIPKAHRRPSGHRVYGPEAHEVLAVIRSCREFGFSIEQVRELVLLSTNAQLPCDETREIAQTHLNAVQAKLSELRQLEKNLTSFIQSCTENCIGGPAPQCNILENIGSSGTQPVAAKGCC